MCSDVRGLFTFLFIFWTCTTRCDAQDLKPCYALVGEWSAKFVLPFGDCYMESVKKSSNLGWMRPQLENINCTMKCAGIKLGLLTKEGGVDPLQVSSFVEGFFQENLQETMFGVVAACAQLATDLEEPDRECSRHGLLFTCVRKGFVNEVYKACYPNARRLKPTFEEIRGNMRGG